MEQLNYPLTLAQQDIYYEQLLYPNSPIYNIGAKIKIDGIIDVITFKKAYEHLINQHDAYRMLVKEQDENVFLEILPKDTYKLEVRDFSEEGDPHKKALKFMNKKFKEPFNFSDQTLLHKFILIKVSSSLHYLFSVYHHIITDGWGTSLMFQRLVKNYNELLGDKKIQSVYPFSYKDFIDDDFQYQNSEDYQKSKTYWKNKFANLPESLTSLISQKKNVSKRKELYIPRKIYNNLIKVTKELNVSSFHFILGLLYVYFGRFYKSDSFSIGLPVLNRSSFRFKKTVGLFMGVSPLKMDIDYELTFPEFIKQIRNQLRQDYRHQRFPLGKLIKELKIFEEKDRLFNITLSYENQNYADHFTGTKATVIPLSHNSERVPLSIYIREFDKEEDVKIDFDYNLSYFNAKRVDQIVTHFDRLLKLLIKEPNQKLRDVNFISKKTKAKILYRFNDTQRFSQKEKTILDFFKSAVQKRTEKIAVNDGETSYTYSELEKKSNQIANLITRNFKLKEAAPIGVLMSRSAHLLPILLGIIKAGRPYIPLDPTFPKDRLSYIVKDSNCELIVVEDLFREEFKFSNCSQISLSNVLDISNSETLTNNLTKENDSAYIIYTSGSTGNPKGVEINHFSLLNFLVSMQSRPGFKTSDVLYAVTTYSFDISILEFFLPLITGGTVFVANNKTLSNPSDIIKELESLKPSIIQATPSFYQMLINAGWKPDKNLKILCGGDLLSESLAENLLSNTKELWNMYGPTETTIWSSTKKINISKDAKNIGSPIRNTSFYILDDWQNLVPVGAEGNIYIGGDGLAKGYYNNRVLTDQKFTSNPFVKGEKIYETGDVGKWDENGEIVFVGRNDQQVKVRGYRIELREIEKKLIGIRDVKEAVVLTKKGHGQESLLLAFIKVDNTFNKNDIITELSKSLPEYMIPKTIVKLEEFPLTPNKKIDRKALLELEVFDNQEDQILPKNKQEKTIVAIWKKVLKINKLGITDNFFSKGGHSLNAVRLIHKLNENFECNLLLKDIFSYPTVLKLSERISIIKNKNLNWIKKADSSAYYDLTESQRNLWLLSRKKISSVAYNMNALYEISGELDNKILERAVQYIISRHESLRTNFIEVDGIPKQVIKKDTNFEISFHFLSQGKGADQLIDYLTGKEFDLEEDILLRFNLIEVGEYRKKILVFTAHHIIMDGKSLEVFITELIANYNSLINEKELNEVPLSIQFKDYAEFLKKEKKVKSSYWKSKLKNFKFNPSFKRDYPKKQFTYKGNSTSFELSYEQTNAIKELAQQQKSTFFSVLVTLIDVLVYKFSGKKDNCLGIVSSGRENYSQLTDQIGMYAQTLPIRSYKKDDDQFVDILLQNNNEIIRSLSEDTSSININYSEFFDILIVYQNPDFSIEILNEMKGVTFKKYPLNHNVSRFPFTFDFYELADKLHCSIEYNTDYYERETIDLIIEKFKKLANEITSNLRTHISELDITLEVEKQLYNSISIDIDF